MLGRILKGRRAGEEHLAWNLPQLRGPETVALTSRDFGDGGDIPPEHHARHVGGRDVSPHLAWTAVPAGTAQLLLVVEDVDIPLGRPAVHCLALVDPAVGHLDPGALGRRHPGPGVRVLRSTVGRGYHGPGPIKGHGPHRYVFQLFALGSALPGAPDARPRAVLSAVDAPVVGRGRLTGVVER
ncbi:YbhB/YbcL family Raf kinase inhibitor-like protein [Pseudonocardia ailaonensis]|uniref:YbhB/YbcL family Raf kinase inhibitor-like protein n=1 Tax=Pseudonocardia ailaonensis TaxID=367279 RepID=A0ABN2NIN8_9PSEU